MKENIDIFFLISPEDHRQTKMELYACDKVLDEGFYR